MARASVISPYQKFYALDGITPLSGGSVKFYANLTTNLISIYADRGLTVPQTNPYTLDAGGAINGDVFFAVTATMVTYDSDGGEVATFDWVTCFDQSIPLALWDATTTYTADYSSGNIVQSTVDDNYYISIQALNLNHEPSANPLWWQPFWDYLAKVQDLITAGYVVIGNASTGVTGLNVNTKGSILVGNGTTPIALAVGTNAHVLKANSATASGLEWAAPASPTVIRSARTSNTVLGTADIGTLIDITSGTFSQTFTAAATLGSGWFCYIRNSGTGTITLDPDVGELINGAATLTLGPNSEVGVQCTGTAFFTFIRETAASGSSKVLLSTVTASAASTADIEYAFDGTYDNYVIESTAITCSDDAVNIYGLVKIGGSYITTGTYYYAGTYGQSNSGTPSAWNGAAQVQMYLLSSTDNASAASHAKLKMEFTNPSSTAIGKFFKFSGYVWDATTPVLYSYDTTAGNTGTGALQGVRIKPSAGTFTSTFRLYGIKNS